MTLQNEDQQWLTLREIDQQAIQPKGAAFRAFKQMEAQLRENQDYLLLRADQDSARIEALRQAGRIYQSSRNVLLLSTMTARRIAEMLR
jgi:hypothetical protein